MNRPILIACIGSVIGIIGGLYLNTSTILFFIFCISFFWVWLKYYSKRKNCFKDILKFNIIIVFAFSVLLSFFYLKIKNNEYENIYECETKELIGEIKSNANANKYTYSYEIRINDKNYIVYIKKKKGAKEFEYGDVIKLTGKIELPDDIRNFGGFSQKNYYKSKGIYGIIYAQEAIVEGKVYSIGRLGNILRKSIKDKLTANLSEENANLLLSLLIGEKSYLSDETLNNFRKSSLIHILCVSRSARRIYNFMDSKNSM